MTQQVAVWTTAGDTAQGQAVPASRRRGNSRITAERLETLGGLWEGLACLAVAASGPDLRGALAGLCRSLAPSGEAAHGAARLRAMAVLAQRVYRYLGGEEELGQGRLRQALREIDQLQGKELLAMVCAGAHRGRIELAAGVDPTAEDAPRLLAPLSDELRALGRAGWRASMWRC